MIVEADPADARPSTMTVVGVDGSPSGGGRTASAVRHVLGVAGAAGARTDVISLADGSTEEASARIDAADGVVIGSPVISASFAFPLKRLFDLLSDTWGRKPTPLQGKAVVMVLTSVDLQHFLALSDLGGLLTNFFAAHVLPPGLHLPHAAYAQDGVLVAPFGALAEQQGTALVEMIAALRRYPTLRGLGPQTFLRDGSER